MKLNKEECLEALESSEYIEVVIRDEKLNVVFHDNFNDTIIYKTFEQLINEHFDNPPLKFEELEEGMWVWDDSVDEKNYSLIKRKFICGEDSIVAMKQDEGKCEDGDDYCRTFEDGRFFAREVNECYT